ncbi:unnamed protein product [Amoebophrya sp. A120]|nr:unnamed protein product [Amoebophrya sp. A120]|eukprot:GSA120T00008558001.1
MHRLHEKWKAREGKGISGKNFRDFEITIARILELNDNWDHEGTYQYFLKKLNRENWGEVEEP